MIITSVGGSLKIEDGFAPLVGFSHTVGVITICTIKKKKLLQKDGTYTFKEIIPINVALDHRYMDGILASKLISEVIKYY